MVVGLAYINTGSSLRTIWHRQCAMNFNGGGGGGGEGEVGDGGGGDGAGEKEQGE